MISKKNIACRGISAIPASECLEEGHVGLLVRCKQKAEGMALSVFLKIESKSNFTVQKKLLHYFLIRPSTNMKSLLLSIQILHRAGNVIRDHISHSLLSYSH